MAANPALVRLLGYASEDELLELSIARDLYMYPEERDNWLRSMAAAGEIRNAELVLRRKDGRKIVVLENSRAVRDEHGRDHLLRRHADRHHRSARAVAAAVVRSESRRALRPDQPPRVRDPPATRARFGAGAGTSPRGVLPRSRSVQDHQRHLRPRRRRRVAATARAGAAGPRAQQRHARAARRRRVRAAAARLRDRDAISGRRTALLKAVEQHQFVWGNSTFTVGASIGLVPREPATSGASRRCCRPPTRRATRPRIRAAIASTSTRKTTRRRAAPRRDAVGRARQARAQRESLLSRSAADRAGAGSATAQPAPSYELLAAHARRVGQHRAARRIPAGGRALQPVAAPRSVGDHDGAALAGGASGATAAHRARVRESVRRFGRRSAAAGLHPRHAATRRGCRPRRSASRSPRPRRSAI